jgi:hypothetical protein
MGAAALGVATSLQRVFAGRCAAATRATRCPLVSARDSISPMLPSPRSSEHLVAYLATYVAAARGEDEEASVIQRTCSCSPQRATTVMESSPSISSRAERSGESHHGRALLKHLGKHPPTLGATADQAAKSPPH